MNISSITTTVAPYSVKRYASRLIVGLWAAIAINLPVFAAINADKSLFITDIAILEQITLQDVAAKLLADSNDGRSANEFLAAAPLHITGSNRGGLVIDTLQTLAISNRFDLAPADGANCGEYRIAFSIQNGATNRTFFIFEARLPNPNSSLGLEGCRPVAEFWANLSNITDINQRAAAIKQFYLQGIAGFAPAIHIDHFKGADNFGEVSGQIRRNINIAESSAWQFNEFTTSANTGFLTLLDSTVKDVPTPSFAGDAAGDANAIAFQNAVLAGLNTPNANLLANSMSFLSYNLPNNANQMSDFINGDRGPGANRLGDFFDPNSTFAQAIQTKLTAVNSTLTPQQVITRTNALTCVGCHAQTQDLGNGLIFNTDNQNREFLSRQKEGTQLGEVTHVEAEHYSQMSGIQTEATADVGGGLNVGWIDQNDWMSYTYVNLPPSASGHYEISLRVASENLSGGIRIEQPGGAKVYANMFAPSTGGWQNWTTLKTIVSLPQGIQGIALVSTGGQWNVNWIQIRPIGNMRFRVKPSLENTFLPERKTILENFLNACAGCDTNMVTNGDFMDGNTGWSSFIDSHANAAISFGGTVKEARISIQNGGDQPWQVQAYQAGLTLQQGKKYQLRFDASTVSPTTFAQFQVMVEKNGAAYDKYLEPQTVSLNTSIKTLTYTFTMNSPTNVDARIAFNMGMNSGVLAIDNVVLKQISP